MRADNVTVTVRHTSDLQRAVPGQCRRQGDFPLTIYSNLRRFAIMKIDLQIMEAAADDASELLKALANRHRLLILCQLIDGEKSVGQLAEYLGIRDSTVSQHLAL